MAEQKTHCWCGGKLDAKGVCASCEQRTFDVGKPSQRFIADLDAARAEIERLKKELTIKKRQLDEGVEGYLKAAASRDELLSLFGLLNQGRVNLTQHHSGGWTVKEPGSNVDLVFDYKDSESVEQALRVAKRAIDAHEGEGKGRPDFVTDEHIEFLDELHTRTHDTIFDMLPDLRERFPDLGMAQLSKLTRYWTQRNEAQYDPHE